MSSTASILVENKHLNHTQGAEKAIKSNRVKQRLTQTRFKPEGRGIRRTAARVAFHTTFMVGNTELGTRFRGKTQSVFDNKESVFEGFYCIVEMHRVGSMRVWFG